MAMLIECEWCGDLLEDDDDVKQDPEDGTPYHRACWRAMREDLNS